MYIYTNIATNILRINIITKYEYLHQIYMILIPNITIYTIYNYLIQI